jgi:hypothetical protein
LLSAQADAQEAELLASKIEAANVKELLKAAYEELQSLRANFEKERIAGHHAKVWVEEPEPSIYLPRNAPLHLQDFVTPITGTGDHAGGEQGRFSRLFLLC